MATVYAGKLSWGTTDETLLAHFAEFNAVSAKVEFTTRLYNGAPRSKGWGLVQFSTVEDANDAIDNLNDTELDGRGILVRMDRGPTEPETKSEPSAVLFVGNLSWDTTAETLGKTFADTGAVESAEIMQTSGGRSKGWGIVTMASVEEAEAAIESINGMTLDDREISVEFKREGPAKKTARAPKKGKKAPRRKRFADGPPPASNKVYVGNLAWAVEDKDLETLFADFNVDEAAVQFTDSGRSRGYAVVTFADIDEATAAIDEMDGLEFCKRNIVVRYNREILADA